MPQPHDLYSPERRTAVLFAGTGAHGAYHAGVLRALTEAGVKVDLLAGRGVGVLAAVFGAVDAGSRLWDATGFWAAAPGQRLYRWHWGYRAAGMTAVGLIVLLLSPALLLAGALVVYPVSLVLGMVGQQAGAELAAWYTGVIAWVMAPPQLPTWLPRLVTLVALGLGAALVVRAVAARRRARPRRHVRGGLAWQLFGAPLEAGTMQLSAAGALWALVRVGASDVRPGAAAVSRRYAELLEGNLGQPAWRELLVAVHDLDARRDLVFGLLAGDAGRRLFPTTGGAAARRLEAFDLAVAAREHLVDVMAAALVPPVAGDPHLMRFGPDTPWRGEAHRLCDRPGTTTRLVDEIAAAGVEQLVIVTGAPEPAGPHTLTSVPADGRTRLGEQIESEETVAARDALHAAQARFHAVFVVRPEHSDVGPFDLGGIEDSASDHRHLPADLMRQGYEDAQRAFIEPALGGAGDRLVAGRP